MKSDAISTTLETLGIRLAGKVVDIPAFDGGIFVPVHVTRNGDGTSNPPKKAFIDAKSALENLGYHPEFLFVDETAEELESSLRASLLVSFPDLVRNAYFSLDGNESNAWIDLKRSAEPAERERLASHAQQFASLFAIPAPNLLSLSEIATPTRLEILSAIRLKAPVTCETLRQTLIEKKLNVPSLDWVNRQFDALRKAGLIARRSDRSYVLTLDALKRLGTRKGRGSADINRLLALARGLV